jgi:hypothetical protein
MPTHSAKSGVNELATTLVEQLSKHPKYMTDYSSAGGGGIHSAQKIEQVSRSHISLVGTLGRILYFAFRLGKYSAEITVSAEYSAGVN